MKIEKFEQNLAVKKRPELELSKKKLDNTNNFTFDKSLKLSHEF